MKTRLLIACLLTSMLAAAHEITQVDCGQTGRVKFHCSDFEDHGRKFVKVHLSAGLWGNGTSDTIVKVSPSYEFDTYAPVAQNDVVTWSNCNETGGNIGEVHSKTVTGCHSLPLKFGKMTVTKLSSAEARVDVELLQVVNVDHVNIQLSYEGKEYFTRAVIFPENTLDRKTYSVIIKLKK